MAPSKKGQLLARVNFPLYTVNVLTDRHILVAGGGGQAKTGIHNVIEIYELLNNGSTCRAEPVTRYETGRQAIMNCTTFHNGKYHVLAAGMEGNCQIYQMKYKILGRHDVQDMKCQKEGNDGSARRSSLRQRRRTGSSHSESERDVDDKGISLQDKPTCSPEEEPSTPASVSDANGNLIETKIGFDIRPMQTYQTDFNKRDDPFQKVVRFSLKVNILATAGADGFIRLWKYPSLTKVLEIGAHEDEVDDLDICPSGNKMVSVSRDGHGYVWMVKEGRKFCELKYELPTKSSNPGEKYVFRGCRFGIVENDIKSTCLFTALNPAVRKKPASPCYLCKWNTVNFTMEKAISAGTDMLCSMATSDDGRFVSVGTLTGDVDVYISFSLQRLYHAEKAHSIFVTGLEFLKTCDETRHITGGQDTSLISISVDNHIIAHHIPRPATMGITGVVLMIIILLTIVYIILDMLNL